MISVASTLAAPFDTEAQQAGKLVRVGVLAVGGAERFREPLRELGYIDGQTLALEYRSSEGSFERLADLAAELVGLHVDVIVAGGSEAVQAGRTATKTIPIVMVFVGDPVAAGFVTSLSRPSGNITGVSNVVDELMGKQLELLKEIVPRMTRIAILWNPPQPAHERQLKTLAVVARSVGVQLQPMAVGTIEDFGAAFSGMKRARADALMILGSDLHSRNSPRLADLAVKARLPATASSRRFALAGGLVGYGANETEMVRRAAADVDKILKGVKPADLPVEHPTKFELVINMKTARALGLTIPLSLLARADQVIE